MCSNGGTVAKSVEMWSRNAKFAAYLGPICKMK